MPPRLNKRQQRELEELEALGGSAKIEGDEAIDHIEPLNRPSAGGFSSLLNPEDSDQGSEGEEELSKSNKSRKSKKKKKKPAVEGTPHAESPGGKDLPQPPPRPSVSAVEKSEKKALKKAKAKEKKAKADELEQALAELSIKYPSSQKVIQKTSDGRTFADLISVSLQHLDSEAEMRKFFGSKVVQANKSGSSPSSGSSSRRQTAAVRSNLTRPQPTWWAAKQREGLTIRTLTEDEVSTKLKEHNWGSLLDEKWWTVDYSKRYKSLTKVFMRTVLSGDPQGFWDLLAKSPWHVDTLLQVSEVYRHREEHAQAFDFVDRALFTYERAFVGAFNFTTGMNRLDFDHVENRPFFLAVHRQVADLQRRGCVRTSFEFARLLYSLDPWSDPHGSLLHLDYLSVKAGMYQWLVDMFEFFETRNKGNASSKRDARLDPSLLPGWAYGRALALRTIEENEKAKDNQRSTDALKHAIRDFPSIVPLLSDKLDLSLPASVRSHPDFRIETEARSLSLPVAALHLLSHLYAQRSSPLWKDHSAWFSETVLGAFSTLPSRLPLTARHKDFLSLYQNDGPRYAAYRHVIVLETTNRRLFPFIPLNVQETKSLSCDPLPPPTAITQYDDEFFKGVDDLASFRTTSRRERAADERRLAQMIPDGAFRQQLQAFFAANPNFGERFPGGIVQFAQAIAQLPPDVLEDMMVAEAMGQDQNPGGMPGGLEIMDFNNGEPEEVRVQIGDGGGGGWGGENREGRVDDHEEEAEEEEEGDDEEGEDEEDVSPMPRVIRNILGRFWGRNVPAEESSSEDEELLDNTGVD